jgi:hypothetical protein
MPHNHGCAFGVRRSAQLAARADVSAAKDESVKKKNLFIIEIH